MVLAELPSFIAQRLKRRRKRDRLGRDSHVSSSLPYRRQASADSQFAGDEVRPSCGAARLGLVVCEKAKFVVHPLHSQNHQG